MTFPPEFKKYVRPTVFLLFVGVLFILYETGTLGRWLQEVGFMMMSTGNDGGFFGNILSLFRDTDLSPYGMMYAAIFGILLLVLYAND